jgi:toxin ParE1/3/4
MAYLVDLTTRAERDLEDLYEKINAAESIASGRWYNGLERAVNALERSPRRCPVVPESRRTGRPLRHLLYGKKPHVYRVVYEIDELQKVVRVLTIRHGARDEASPEEL